MVQRPLPAFVTHWLAALRPALARNDMKKLTVFDTNRQHHIGKVVLVIRRGQDDGT